MSKVFLKKGLQIINSGEGVKKREASYFVGGNVMENSMEVP